MAQQITRQEIITLYKQGGFLAKTSIDHRWYLYALDYKPIYEHGGSLAKMIQSEIPSRMENSKELEIDYRDTLAKMYVYKLSDDMILYASGYDPDEVGQQMKAVTDEALHKITVNQVTKAEQLPLIGK